MYFDVLTMAAVADEIRERILHGRVQKTIMIAPLTLGLEIYAQHQRHYLLVSADSQKARIHFCSQKLRSGIGTPSPLLKKRLVMLRSLPDAFGRFWIGCSWLVGRQRKASLYRRNRYGVDWSRS